MKSNNNNNEDDDDDNNNNTAMGSVQARGDTFLTFGLKALTETNTSRLATGVYQQNSSNAVYSYQFRCMHVHVMAPGQRFYG
jgi:hypothetical protein